MDYWPVKEPFKSGLLRVGKLHSVWYGLYGNPDGYPVFFFHGGPGAATKDSDARWFDPDKYLVVLHHQRGCGNSVPNREIRENTTWDLVEDVNRLREHLNISKRIILFAGSWGTTLALLYSEKYPENVSRMVMRGTWLAEYDSQEFFYARDGMGMEKPEEWQRLSDSLPAGNMRISEKLDYVYTNGTPEQVEKCAKAQMRYEYSLFNMPEEELIKEVANYQSCFTEMRLVAYYLSKRMFIEDGQILRDVKKIENIPATFINGEKDIICCPDQARRLHERMPNSMHRIVSDAGHLSSDDGISHALLEVMEEIKKSI